MRTTFALLAFAVLLQAGCHDHPGETTLPGPSWEKWADPRLDSLLDLSIESLRAREYGSTIVPLKAITTGNDEDATTLLAAYDSDGLKLYTRIDVPGGEMPHGGFPAVIFVHGWYGIDKAPTFEFFLSPDSSYAEYVDRFVDAGFVVLSPALRGHGTVDGIPADGIEFLEAWDNGSYISPMFYAIDVLNLLDGIGSLDNVDWASWGREDGFAVDRTRVSITGHSQGGDAVLTALAVSGEGSAVHNPLMAGSIVSGCFGSRTMQAAIYGPMANTLEAFMSGDGSWTGTTTGHDGSVNPEFVFGWPPDWIGTVDPRSPEWTWQAETWSVPTVAESLRMKYDEMYQAINEGADDVSDATFELARDESGRTVVRHDPRIESAMPRLGGFGYEKYLTEPLHLHHSDRDYYSIPQWNADLSARINEIGGMSVDFAYPKNDHGLRASDHDWFSDGEVVSGFAFMLERDIRLFNTGDTAPPVLSETELTSPEGLARYASSLKNELRPAYEREPLDGLARRVVSFTADGLKQYALIVEPAGAAPENGWPVILMNHGHHPNPPDNGKRADGTTDRPGDYYRGIPAAYAEAGFLVAWPDYRGHNVSEGYEYTQTPDPHGWYARDVIALVRALPTLPRADTSRVFLWGHSIGADVSLRAAGALAGEILGAALWSSMLRESGGEFYVPDASGMPILVQHDSSDPAVPLGHSEVLLREREAAGAPTRLIRLPGEEHLFLGETMHGAVDRDVAFFRDLLSEY